MKKEVYEKIIQFKSIIMTNIINFHAANNPNFFDQFILYENINDIINEYLSPTAVDKQTAETLLVPLFTKPQEENLFTFINQLVLTPQPKDPERVKYMVQTIFGNPERINKYIEQKYNVCYLLYFFSPQVSFNPEALQYIIPQMPVELHSLHSCKGLLEMSEILNGSNILIPNMSLMKMIEVIDRVDISNAKELLPSQNEFNSLIRKLLVSEIYQQINENVLLLVKKYVEKIGDIGKSILILCYYINKMTEYHFPLLHYIFVELKVKGLKKDNLEKINQIPCQEEYNLHLKEELMNYYKDLMK